MKRLTAAFVLCAIGPLASLAQGPITVSQSTIESMFTAGHRVSIYVGTSPTDTTVDVGLQGANRVYDFSSVSFTLVKIDTVRQVSTIPYLASRYPGSAVAQDFSGDGNEINHPIWIVQDEALRSVGDYEQVNADSLIIEHNDPYDIFLKLPIQFGGSTSMTVTHTDSIFSKGALHTAFAVTIPIYTVVDGWGTLKLPGEPDRPCLRVRWYEDPGDFHAKSFRFVTNDGIISNVDTRNDQPDEGLVKIRSNFVLFKSSSITSVPGSSAPVQFSLHQNYPNPFNPSTRFAFQIPTAGLVTLRIFDLLGREAAIVLQKELNAGLHRVEWQANNLPSGMYLYRLETGQWRETKKLLVIK